MLKHASRHAFAAGIVMIAVVACAMAGQNSKQSVAPPIKQPDPNREKVAGVILSVESIAGGDSARKGSWKMIVNTDVEWRDFVRDQAVDPRKAARTGTSKAAAKGRGSVATKGHPTDDPLLLTLEINPQTEITVRYRSSTDAIGEGAPNPAGASKAEDAADASSSKAKSPRTPAGAGTRRDAPKARTLEPMELKPGLWVEVDFKHDEAKNGARRVVVLRPVGGPDTSPEKEQGATTKTTVPGR